MIDFAGQHWGLGASVRIRPRQPTCHDAALMRPAFLHDMSLLRLPAFRAAAFALTLQQPERKRR